MTSDFAVFPAGVASSITEAETAVRKMQESAQFDPNPQLAELINKLVEEFGRSVSVGRNADSAGAILKVADWGLESLHSILTATKAHSMSVFDLDLSRLYDPRDSVDVEVTLGGSCSLPYLNAKLLNELVRRPTWPDPDSPFLIVARAGEEYIQTYLQEDGFYDLEYRDGSFDKHFDFYTLNSDVVSDVMWAWTIEDPRWRTAVPWNRLELDE